jgi:ATP-dependent Lon protease
VEKFYQLVELKKRSLPRKEQILRDYSLQVEQKGYFRIKEDYIKDLNFHYVTEMKEVIDLALMKDKVKNAQDLTIRIKADLKD